MLGPQGQRKHVPDIGSTELEGALAPVVQTLDSAIHWINHYPMDNAVVFHDTYPLNSTVGG